MGGCGSSIRLPNEKRFRRAIKLYEVSEVESMTNVFNRNRCFETGDSPLTLATQQGHEVIVESLLDAGAEVNRLDANGRAAIHVACQLNDLPTLKILLDHGADANRVAADRHTTPLHIAAERGFAPVVTELLDGGAVADGVSPADTDSAAAVTGTPLIVAVTHGRVDCVAELLLAGADTNAQDVRGQTPAHLAVVNDDVSCVRLVLQQCPGPIDVTDLLGLAVVGGASADVVEALIKSGRCDVEDAGRRGPCRPLMLAGLKGRADVVDLLLDAGVDVDAELIDEQDRQRLTALQLAVSAAVDPHYKTDYCKRYLAETWSVRASQRRRHQQPVDVSSSCHGDGYVRCVMSLVQGGASVAGVWRTFVKTFPARRTGTISFQQMVVCEVLVQAYSFTSVSREEVGAFVERLLQVGEFSLVKLVYSAGVEANVCHYQQLQGTPSHQLASSMLEYIARLLHTPRRLKDLCRREIRRHLASNVLWQISQLHVRDSIKEYLCIMDTDHYTGLT